jgi:hypothetical protein
METTTLQAVCQEPLRSEKKAINPADAPIFQVRHKQRSPRLVISMESHQEHRLIPGPLIYRLDVAQCN